MRADPTFVTNFWGQVNGSSDITGIWTFPCDSKVPDLYVSFGRTGSHAIAGTTFNAGFYNKEKGMFL